MSEQNGSSWSHTTLGELLREVEVRVRNLPSNESANLEVLSLTKNWGLIPQTERFDKRVATEDISKYKVVRPGWIVYNPYVIWEGAVHALRRSEPGVVSPVYPVFERTEDDGGFLDFVLRTDALIDAYNQFSSGAVNRRRSIKKNDFLGIEITVPPLPEQRAIAHVLRTVQQAKEATEKVSAATRQLKQSLMRHLFTYGLVPFDQADRVKLKETEIGEIREEWSVADLSSLSELMQYGTSSRCDADPTNWLVLRIPNVIGGAINLSELKFLKADEQEAQRYLLQPGDLLFVRTNGQRSHVGRCAVFRGEPRKALFASYLIRVRAKSSEILPDFVQLYSETERGRSFLSGRASGAADGKFNINTQILRTVLVPKPLREEQRQIVAQLAAVTAKLAAEETRHDALDALFQSLLHHLMTGKVRVHDLGLPAMRKTAL